MDEGSIALMSSNYNDVGGVLLSKSNERPLVYQGVRYYSLVKMAQILNLPYQRLRLEYAESHDLDKAVERTEIYLELKQKGFYNLNNKRCIPEVYNDKQYASHMDLCDEYGLSYSMVYSIKNFRKARFMDVFDALVCFKQRIGMSKDQMLVKIPALIINGEPYNSVAAGLRAIGLSTEQVYRYELVGLPDDKIETLKYMQTLKNTVRVYEGEVVNNRSLMRHGKEWRVLATKNAVDTEVPRFPSLQGLDFSQGFYDAGAILEQELKAHLGQSEDKQQVQGPQIGL